MSDSGIKVGTQGSALFGDNLNASKKIGENLSDVQAVDLAKKTEGSELLIEKNKDGTKTYDVYQLTNEKTGKALTTTNLFEGKVNLDRNMSKKFGGESATIAAVEKDPKSTYFVEVRKPDFIGELGWGIKAAALNTASVITGGKPELPVRLGSIAENEDLESIANRLPDEKK
jgi:hypothetical protein